jgi:hypothetical protein
VPGSEPAPACLLGDAAAHELDSALMRKVGASHQVLAIAGPIVPALSTLPSTWPDWEGGSEGRPSGPHTKSDLLNAQPQTSRTTERQVMARECFMSGTEESNRRDLFP